MFQYCKLIENFFHANLGWAKKRTGKNFSHLTESLVQNAGFLNTKIPENTLPKKNEKKEKKRRRRKHSSSKSSFFYILPKIEPTMIHTFLFFLAEKSDWNC